MAAPRTPEEILTDIEAELRAREETEQLGGLILLPDLLPKPQPPPEFWDEGEGPDAVKPPTAKEAATAALRALMIERRKNPPR